MPRVKPFIAVDGEAYDHPSTGEHIYACLVSSTPADYTDLDGVSTAAALRFLSVLKAAHPNSVLVGFWFGYDVNMILRDLDWKQLERLWTHGFTFWRGWRIEWTPGKWFGARGPLGESFRVYDVEGFFQGSFLKALDSWGVGEPKELAIIRRMKAARGTFRKRQVPAMVRYARLECVYLVEMMERLRGAFQQAGFQPVGWYGAGAAAAGLLRAQGVRRYITPDDQLPVDVRDVCERAYFGGRVELLLQGEHERVYSHDIASAYPAALASMPAATGEYRPVRKPRGPLDRNGIYHVAWDVDPRLPVMPFPHRTKRTIYYPSNGNGWYHAVEIEAARLIHPGIKVGRGYVLEPDTDTLPFDFVPRIFEERREAKRLGEAREKAYKLAMNSLYGKLAQREGFKDELPPYRCAYWAGRVTAWTRAQLLTKAAQHPSAIISFATDGILATHPLGGDNTGDLGSWEHEAWTDLLAVQPGVYFAKRDGREIFKSRGWNAKEIEVQTLRDAWNVFGYRAELKVPATRFVGLGMALHRNDRTSWRCWPDTMRLLRFYPSRKFPDPEYRPGDGIHRLLHPSGERFLTTSEPFAKRARLPVDESPDP